MSGPWEPWAAKKLAKAAFVVFEKPHGLFFPPVNTSAETKIAAACKQVKEASTEMNTETDCYIYTEVDWARTYYSLGHAVDADLANLGMHYDNGTAFGTTNNLKTPNNVLGPGGVQDYHYTFHAYDFRQPKMQALWAKRITDAVATGHVDGAFIDGNRGGWGFGNCNACPKDRAAHNKCCDALKAGLKAAHYAVAKAVGPNATLISNYPTPEALEVCNGGMCERCGHDTSAVEQLHKTYFGARTCGLRNESCVLQYRCFGNNGQHGRETHTPYQDVQNQSIATFLMAMGPYSYYGGGSETGIGPQACNMSDGSMHFPDWPDMRRPLGAPRGDYKVTTVGSDRVFTREFSTGTRVVMNATGVPSNPAKATAGNFKCIYWSDGFVTGEGGEQPCPSKATIDEIFALDWA